MSEHREKEGTALLKFSGKTGLKIELFPAAQWDHPDADVGLFRLRVNGQWLGLEGKKYSFFTPEAAFSFMAREVLGAGTEGVEREEKIRRGDRVRVDSLFPDVTELTNAVTKPFVGADGRARVFVIGHEEPFLLADVRRVK